MADTAFSVKVDDKLFTVDRITLGDWRMLRTEFGLKASDMLAEVPTENGPVQVWNIDDPNVLVGLMVTALCHERPNAQIRTLIAEVEALTMDGVDFSTDEDEEAEEADPTEGGDDDSEATAEPSKSGKSGKPRKKPGIPN